MKKLVLLAAIVAVFTVPSVLAESCPSECEGKKGKEGSKESEKQTMTVEVSL
jgi:hypothetical protein